MPIANNSSDARQAFEERKLYDQEAAAALQGTTDFLFDLWNSKKILYGRVDLAGDAILPDINKIVYVGDENYIFNFVYEAYNDLLDFIEKSTVFRTLDPSAGKIFPLNIEKGYSKVNETYQNYIGDLYVKFVTFLDNNQSVEVKNFDDFIKEFLSFLEFEETYILTKTQFIQSKLASPLASGLMIETKLIPHDNDSLKSSNYLNDPNFKYYVEAARRHGFHVDKNAPWRLICDVRSCYIYEKLVTSEDYSISQGERYFVDYFKTFYRKAAESEIGSLANIMYRMWDNFAYVRPTAYVLRDSYCDGNLSPLLSKISRKRYTEQEFMQKYDEGWWVRKVTDARTRELFGFQDENYSRDLSRSVSSLIINAGLPEAARYMENKLKNEFRAMVGYDLTKIKPFYRILEEPCILDIPEPIEEVDLSCPDDLPEQPDQTTPLPWSENVLPVESGGNPSIGNSPDIETTEGVGSVSNPIVSNPVPVGGSDNDESEEDFSFGTLLPRY